MKPRPDGGAQRQPQRRFKRTALYIPADVEIGEGDSAALRGTIRSIVADLAPGGMQILMGSAHHVGSYLTVALDLDGIQVKCGVVVKHVHWVSATPSMTFGHGAEIVDISRENLRAIVQYLSRKLASGPRSLKRAA